MLVASDRKLFKGGKDPSDFQDVQSCVASRFDVETDRGHLSRKDPGSTKSLKCLPIQIPFAVEVMTSYRQTSVANELG